MIRGIGSSLDGRAKSVYAPLRRGPGAGAAPRLRGRPATAPATVELVEAHGTGTEGRRRGRVRGAARGVRRSRAARRPQWCALGSVKSQIGHTKAAAGAAGLIKAVLALHHKVLPPTIKVERPNPALAARDAARST